jgi:hypothetical protein
VSRRSIAQVRVLKLPHLHPEALRVEIDCRHSTTGLTSVPSPAISFTRPQLVTTAVIEHEARCGDCDTTEAHQQGDATLHRLAIEADGFIRAELTRQHAHGRRN